MAACPRNAGIREAMLTLDRMRKKLAKAVEAAGGQKAWADANGVSPQYVCDCLNGRKLIGEGIARPMGYRPVTVYVPDKESE